MCCGEGAVGVRRVYEEGCGCKGGNVWLRVGVVEFGLVYRLVEGGRVDCCVSVRFWIVANLML